MLLWLKRHGAKRPEPNLPVEDDDSEGGREAVLAFLAKTLLLRE